ncbi:aldolase/citrate lyase family protein [Rhodoferax sp.]|uniref:HpcH/HpaI aldolase family protein n=1 Tax=Rhodoferax sp. TaxID=50421 RepID=UPI002638D8F8|nr:aldolase/citrate lyase family protein [Rhodoferax sp.]MDD2924648.1 aldolase/citrate lyase family protein [Rhodoferax sp.]
MANFLQTLAQPGSCQLGTWVKLGTLETLEALALAGFDFVVIDMEHAPHTYETAYRCIVGAQGFGMRALVRLPDSNGTDVQRILDSGADGVLVPRVRCAEEARQVMDGMIFSPRGSRGLGITSRAGHWGLKTTAQYVEHGNTAVFRGVQLEEVEALRQADQIMGVEGVNAVFVGAGDLALSSGKPANHPDNAALIDQLLTTARQLGLPCGTAVGDAAMARQARERGFNYVMVSNDLSLFAKAAAELVRGLKN